MHTNVHCGEADDPSQKDRVHQGNGESCMCGIVYLNYYSSAFRYVCLQGTVQL